MIKILKKLLCKHEYISSGYCSGVGADGNFHDTGYIFRCRKCSKEKTVCTHGYDYNLNNNLHMIPN